MCAYYIKALLLYYSDPPLELTVNAELLLSAFFYAIFLLLHDDDKGYVPCPLKMDSY